MKRYAFASLGALSALTLCSILTRDGVHAGGLESLLKEPRRPQFTVSDSPLKSLPAAEVAKKKALSKFVKDLEAKSDRLVIMKVDEPVFEISSDVLSKLFPKWSFYVVPFRMEKHPEATEPVSIAFGLYSVLGVNDDDKSFEFFGYGNYDEFGRFLAAQGVRCRNDEEAKQIWTAYCHVHRRGSSTLTPKKVDDKRWHLGTQVIGDREYYYPVRTSDDGSVQSFRLESRLVSKKLS